MIDTCITYDQPAPEWFYKPLSGNHIYLSTCLFNTCLVQCNTLYVSRTLLQQRRREQTYNILLREQSYILHVLFMYVEVQNSDVYLGGNYNLTI